MHAMHKLLKSNTQLKILLHGIALNTSEINKHKLAINPNKLNQINWHYLNRNKNAAYDLERVDSWLLHYLNIIWLWPDKDELKKIFKRPIRKLNTQFRVLYNKILKKYIRGAVWDRQLVQTVLFIVLLHPMNVELDWDVGSLEVRFMPLGALSCSLSHCWIVFVLWEGKLLEENPLLNTALP